MLGFEPRAGAARLTVSAPGVAQRLREGDSVAAALLAVGVKSFRDTPVSAAPRGPYCMMGVCFDCLVEIDGVANRQACLIAAAEGMVVRRQSGPRKLAE